MQLVNYTLQSWANVGPLIDLPPLLDLILMVNILLAIFMIFTERRNPTSALAWLSILLFLPAIGFVLYLVFGQNFHKRRMFRLKEQDDRYFREIIRTQKSDLLEHPHDFGDEHLEAFRSMVTMLLENNEAVLSRDNQLEVYTRGEDMFAALLEAIKGARQHIHLEYFIIRDDLLGRSVLAALAEKAREGIEVRLLYDAVGCNKVRKSFFSPLTESGGEVASFFPAILPHINLRVNYRNHRKIAVIDGVTGFIGGFNIGDEYLGKDPFLGYWRDTHLRIRGSAVYGLQLRFFMDWNFAARGDLGFEGKYFPSPQIQGAVAVQVVSSGPDARWNQIKEGYLKLISLARESIYLQSPYFVPDESVSDALRIAALSGIDVRVMVPARPDHPFVKWTNCSYIGELLEAGVRTYRYEKGFIHSKTVVVDGIAASVGTANWDVRSFRLNFETNAFIYDCEIAGRLKREFESDIQDSVEITSEMYKKRSKIVKMKESVSRLFSPIL
ncbi:MAG: cardiolipin synthase [Methanoregulaceae archaeon]|nr:cardiolipin synthase [Methanoregulaceae archaeon]